jgi:hypothetical protein
MSSTMQVIEATPKREPQADGLTGLRGHAVDAAIHDAGQCCRDGMTA